MPFCAVASLGGLPPPVNCQRTRDHFIRLGIREWRGRG